MANQFQHLYDAVEKHRQMILDAERHIWNNPETGYREWKTHRYLKKLYEDLGYQVREAGNIPGFFADVETGKPGPKIAVFGELDSLIVPTHPECDKETGAVHACAHNCQSAALLGIAAALKEPGALEGLCGSIRLIAVPAEEMIEIGFRRQLRDAGTIRYLTGKLEFLYRGILDGVDLAMMVHTSSKNAFSCIKGSDGGMTKMFVFRGKSAHAGGSPQKGLNALYAATTALSAANALRETFVEEDYIRFHPIITKGGSAVNSIPDEVVCESYVRGASIPATRAANEKINCAIAASAAAIGCKVEFNDEHGFAPRQNDENLAQAFYQVAADFFSPEHMTPYGRWSTGSSDMGDICCVMPAIHPHIPGCTGQSHSDTFYITDPVTACVTSAKIQSGVLALLLSDGASYAKKVLAEAKVPYESKEAFFREIDSFRFEGEGVIYNDDGTVTLRYKNA